MKEITKKEWYELNDGKMVEVKKECLKAIEERQNLMISDYKELIKNINKEHGEEIATMKIDDKGINFNNGEFVLFPYSCLLKKSKSKLIVKSKQIIVCDVYHDKKNLIILNEKEFCFKDKEKLIYQIK